MTAILEAMMPIYEEGNNENVTRKYDAKENLYNKTRRSRQNRITFHKQRPVLMGCTPYCNWKCTDNFTDDERKGTNDMHYDLNNDQKRTFILECVTKKHCRKKRRC